MIDQTFSVVDGIGQCDESFSEIVRWGRSPRPAPDRSGSIGKPAFIAGRQIVRWMSAYGVTIRELSERFKSAGARVPMTRVRQVRDQGIFGSVMVMDWMWMITGSDPWKDAEQAVGRRVATHLGLN